AHLPLYHEVENTHQQENCKKDSDALWLLVPSIAKFARLLKHTILSSFTHKRDARAIEGFYFGVISVLSTPFWFVLSDVSPRSGVIARFMDYHKILSSSN
ncbi:hypothetical protein Ancab_008106, partial [Ancistrocladus abbreviatus]